MEDLQNTMPKTIRNKFDKILSYETLMEAHKKSRKGKGYRNEIIKFNLKQEEYIMWLYNELKNGTYKHGGYKVFYVTEPKVRKIEKSNRGMHRAALYVQKCMKSALAKWEEYYVLKMDVAKYFDSIDKNILFKILQRKIKDRKLLWLVKEILFSQKRDKGLEIGNYTSQMFGNIYLNEQDQFVKHKLHIKYYARYLDDSVIIVKTKEEAKIALKEIAKFLEENLRLKLNNKTQIFKGKQGINFCRIQNK